MSKHARGRVVALIAAAILSLAGAGQVRADVVPIQPTTTPTLTPIAVLTVTQTVTQTVTHNAKEPAGTMTPTATPQRGIIDSEGVDIWPLIRDTARKYDLPPALLLAVVKVESELTRTAARYGRWPDVSFGYTQVIVSTAGAFGVGNGMATRNNIAAVREYMFDRANALDLGARVLAYSYKQAEHYKPRNLYALYAYNCGHCPAPNDSYWRRYAGNVARIQRSLAWAEAQVAALEDAGEEEGGTDGPKPDVGNAGGTGAGDGGADHRAQRAPEE